MSITINGSGIGVNLGGHINTNSKQYKAAMAMFGKKQQLRIWDLHKSKE